MNQKTVIAILGATAVILAGTTIYFATTPAPKIERQSTAPTPVTQQQVIDTSGWQLFNAEKEGMATSILPNFKFPQNWHTLNIAGGRMVEIIFSDSNQKNIADKIDNECRFSILFNGDNGSQKISKNNSKNTTALRDECNLILAELEKQVAK